MSKIFGELSHAHRRLITAAPSTKQQLASTRPGQFSMCRSNLYIIGMMNTADRSLAMLDYALRRRFVL